MLRRLLAVTCASLALLLVDRPASANGRFPAAGQIAVDACNPDHIIVRATYGILTTQDAGGYWSWICEEAVGYTGFVDPMMGITCDGTLLAGIYEGLVVSPDGCQWDFEQGELKGRYALDLSVERGDPKRSVVIVSNSSGDGGFSTSVFESPDNAVTWSQAGVSLPTAMIGLTVDTAPSDPNRVYVSGKFNTTDTGVLMRSKDRGATWDTLPIPGSNGANLPFIGAIDPLNPDVVYVRIDSDPADELVVTKDGGATWSVAFTAMGSLLGFALSPDGATVALGGKADGLWTAPASTLAFSKKAVLDVKCLTWTTAGLYACTDEFTDGFTAGLSKNDGATFTSILHLNSVCGPLACAPGTSVGMKCPAVWPVTEMVLGEGPSCGTGGGAAGGTGGADASTSSGAGGAGGAASTSGGGAGDCACRTPAAPSAELLPAVLLAALAALLRGRQRRSRPQPPRRSAPSRVAA